MLKKTWDRGHENGWLVLKNGQPIAKLEYYGIDDPCTLFRLVCVSSDPEVLRGLVGLRGADPSIVFQNLKTNEIVRDYFFILHSYEKDIVSLRDFRFAPMYTMWRSVTRQLGTFCEALKKPLKWLHICC